jgi:hypothetical protein
MLGGCLQFPTMQIVGDHDRDDLHGRNFVAVTVSDIQYGQIVGEGGVEGVGFDSEMRVWPCLGPESGIVLPKIRQPRTNRELNPSCSLLRLLIRLCPLPQSLSPVPPSCPPPVRPKPACPLPVWHRIMML